MQLDALLCAARVICRAWTQSSSRAVADTPQESCLHTLQGLHSVNFEPCLQGQCCSLLLGEHTMLLQSYHQGSSGQAIPGTSTRNVCLQLPFMASPECFWKPPEPMRDQKTDGASSFEQLGQLHSTLHTSMWKSPGSPLHVMGICTRAASSLLLHVWGECGKPSAP